MLNPFPIQFLALFAYFVLRVCVGSILLYLGITHWSARHELASIFKRTWWRYGLINAVLLSVSELIIAISLIMGAYTQLAALGTAFIALKFILVRNRFNHPSLPPRLFYLLLLGSALSLFITGAGAFAVDLPL